MTKLRSFSESISTGSRKSRASIFATSWDTTRIYTGTREMKRLKGRGHSDAEIKKMLSAKGWSARIIGLIFSQAATKSEEKAKKLTARATGRKSVIKYLLDKKLSSVDIRNLLTPTGTATRPELVSYLMKTKQLSSKEIGKIRTLRKKYGPFRKQEVKESLIDLGVSEIDLWSGTQNRLVPQGNNYHPIVGWY